MPIPTELIQTLADLYPEPRDARMLWERAGGRGSQVESNPNPRDMWQTIWRRCNQGASVTPGALLRAALEDNEHNTIFMRAIVAVQAESFPIHASQAPVSPVEAPEVELARLLISMFSAVELRIFLRHLPDGSGIDAALPGSTVSLAEVAHAASKLLFSRGYLGAPLFDSLRVERPRRAAEIDALEARLVKLGTG